MKLFTTKGLTRAGLRGFSIVPLLTPVTADHQIDEPAVARIIGHILDGGCQGLMVCGTTGEFASMSVAMRLRLVELAVSAARGRAVIFGGIGDNSPAHSLTLAQGFLAAGVDAVVANLPSYYPLTPEMIERYFADLADGINGPVYLYNIPQTTRQSIPLDVIGRLSQHPRIAGIKDSEPDGARQEELCRMFAGRPDFAVFCGSVPFTSRAMRAGADGFVPGAGNFVPALTRRLMDLEVAGDEEGADAVQFKINAINAIYQKGRIISQVFGALKAVMEIQGLCSRHVFPPLLPVGDAEVEQLRAQLRELGVLQ